jgi:hypothetical protein
VHYWSAERLATTLEQIGFRVRRHLMVDVLPYPHVLYVCQKLSREMGDLTSPPMPPALGHAPGNPGRASILRQAPGP